MVFELGSNILTTRPKGLVWGQILDFGGRHDSQGQLATLLHKDRQIISIMLQPMPF